MDNFFIYAWDEIYWRKPINMRESKMSLRAVRSDATR